MDVRAAELGELLARSSGWQPPERRSFDGRLVRLEPLDRERHGDDLHAGTHGSEVAEAVWTYLPVGPFERPAYEDWLRYAERSTDSLFFVIRDLGDGRVKGQASLMRIVPEMGVIEIGFIWFAPELQRTAQATEAMYLLFAYVFDGLGYRRFEWKCNALNLNSRRAAERLGFTFEGVFRQHMVVKGRNRDTAWFSMLDHEWPSRRAAFEAWLAPENFDAEGRQRQRLEDFRR